MSAPRGGPSAEKGARRFPPIRHDDGTWTLWHPDSPGIRLRLHPSLLRRLRVVRSPFATLGETTRYYKRKPCPLCGQPRRRHDPICPAGTHPLPPVIHTPCGHDWTDQTHRHECRFTMDHDGPHACTCGNTRVLPPAEKDAGACEHDWVFDGYFWHHCRECGRVS